MTMREALIDVIECLHVEIGALKANDVNALEAATSAKLSAIERVAANDNGRRDDMEINDLVAEASRLNETARIYVNLMAANVRRRLQDLAGLGVTPYRPTAAVAAYSL